MIRSLTAAIVFMPRSAPYHDFANRLSDICDKAGVPDGRQRVTAVANQFGVARETVRLWFAGEVLPALPRLIEIAEAYHCSLDWLAMGRETRAKIDKHTPVYDALSSQERSVVSAMRGLSERRRAGLVALLREQ
ncbi:helix-turn-helix domain-containing protein [Dyella lutea]|uniref:Helix-turn-helix domain-containing protein n=1 Tax=Dyella lutea TaxID=2950441 RepID=A0ABT1FF11_9GAMM|nr:helix-turn-helix domain-containing protein [Dyella lutea]MCP1374688.1 helix-turn-helix domain-containing protein [Dyella lutea]